MATIDLNLTEVDIDAIQMAELVNNSDDQELRQFSENLDNDVRQNIIYGYPAKSPYEEMQREKIEEFAKLMENMSLDEVETLINSFK